MGSSFKYSIPLKPYIGGEFVEACGDRRLSLLSAIDDTVVTNDLRCAVADDVDRAVESAEEGLSRWQGLPLSQRQALMERYADLIIENAEHLGYLETIVTGKPISVSGYHEPRKAAAHIKYYAGYVNKFNGELVPADDGLLQLVRHQPYGICAGINPFNAPMICFAMKVGPALATGNVVISKPSEYNPLSTLYLAHLATTVGIPPGVLNVLVCEAEAGEALSRHTKIRKISFTGSVSTGKKIQVAATQSNLKSVTLELGGKSPVLVFPDADMEVAVRESTAFLKLNGQGCILGTRIYVHESIADNFLASLKNKVEEHAANLQKDPYSPDTISSPLFHHRQQDGARAVMLRRQSSSGPLLMPGILREEIFGPVCVVDTFSSEDEALQKANDTSFGLGAVVFTRGIGTAVRVSSALEAGTVTVNNTNYTDPGYPFGGWKDSGIGTENGRYVLEGYTQLKSIIIKY